MDKKKFNIKKHPFLLVWLVIICVTIKLEGCSNQNPFGPPENSVHPASYIDPMFLGTTQFHGSDTAKNGVGSCRICHGADLDGTDTKSGCYDCHFDLNGSREPESSNWLHGTNPHSNPAEYLSTCNRCHNFMRSYEYPPETCHDCHGQGLNHVLGQPWLDKKSTDFHGDQDLLDCGNCHDLSSECSQCHFDASGSKTPPASDWYHGSSEDHDGTSTYIAVCNQCHSLNRDYGNPPSSCHDCHESYESP